MRLNKLLIISAIALASMLTACGSTGSKDETAKWDEQKMYKEAQDELKSGGYDRAVTLLEKLESRFPFGVYAQQAQLDIAYAHYKANSRVEGLAAIDRFMKLHPSHPASDYALYLKGLLNFNDRLGIFGNLISQDPSERDQQSMRESFEAFKELTTRFPDSKYASDARDRMGYVVNALARYDVAVAKYYYKRGGYTAAANRAQKTILEFQQAPAIEEALVILAQSYERMGLTDLKNDVERVYKTSYPKGTLMSKGVEDSQLSWWKFW
jgi:outer membrane protein assembly factor BamD